MTNYTYLGWGTTDSNGVAKLDHDANDDPLSHSYTGSGVGEVDVVASLDKPIVSGSVVSIPYEVTDCKFWDIGTTGTPNTEWYSNIDNVVSDSNGLKWTNNTTTQYYLTPNDPNTPHTSMSDYVDWAQPLCFEFDLLDFTGTARFETRNINGTLSPFDLVSTYIGKNIKLKYKNNQLTLFVDDTQVGTPKSETTKVMFRFIVTGGYIQFKNFKIYPI